MDQEPAAKDVTLNTNRKLNGLEFKEGYRLEARDHLGDKWWDAKIVEVDHEGCEVLVHFQGWNGRHDEWIKMDSPRLQPLHRRSRRLSTGPAVDGIQVSPGPSTTTTPSSNAATPTHTGPSLYCAGEEVLALWKQNRKYPATILRIQDDGGYVVRFYDGFEKVVRGQCIRRIGKQDLEFVKQCKEQIVTNGEKDIVDEDNNSKDDLDMDDTPPPSKLRRERKSKFNVREILNLAPAKKPTSITNSRSRTNSSDGLEKASFERSDKVFDKAKNGDEVKRHCKEENESISDAIDLNDSLDLKSEKSISETGSEGTPSEKENFNCEMVGKFKSKSKDPSVDKMGGMELKGKRERKRKRFADEEPESPIKKISKRSNSNTSSNTPVLKNAKSSRVPAKSESVHNNSQVLSQQGKGIKNAASTELPVKKKSRDKSKSIENIENNKSNSSKTLVAANNSRTVKSASVGRKNSEKSSDKNFSYLSFDFNLPQEKMVAHLIEGVTVPGSNKPVIIKAPKLPSGWVKKVVLRGVNHLKWEVVIENTLGKSFKSRAELIRYFEEQKFEANLEHFDFTLDTPLKKIRQIWRANLNQTDSKSSLTNGVKDESDSPSNSLESRLPLPIPNNSTTSPPHTRKILKTSTSSKVIEKLKIEPQPSSSSPSLPSPLPSPVVSTNSSPTFSNQSLLPVTSPSPANIMNNSPLIIKGNVSETGQGVRCPLKECNKLFRNDKLLQMHVKHYHPEYAPPGESPTVKDLASSRTLKEVETSPIVGDLKPIKSPEAVQSVLSPKDDKFKVPVNKQISKAETNLVETLSEAVKEETLIDEVVTDGAVETNGGEETDIVKDVPDEKETDKIQETPKVSKSRPRRLRNDSMMSGSSDAVFTPPPSPHDSAPPSSLPSPAPTYKMSKKRAQQLRSAPSTPPGELKDGTETMSEGEVVHCSHCLHTEGDGMMVQCESCLTWQHGSCLGIDRADQVPDKYICSVCIAPPLARQSSLYTLDMDWIREGKLSTMDQEHSQDLESVKIMENELKNLSDLMTDLVNLSSVLHSLQVKLSVARLKNNPKVFMWSNIWDETSIGVVEAEENNVDTTLVTEETDNTFETVEDEVQEDVKTDLKLVKKELENHISDNTENEKVVSNGDVDHVENEDDLKFEPSVVKNEDNIEKPVNSSLDLKEGDKLEGNDKQPENKDSSDEDETNSKVVDEQEAKQNSPPVLNSEVPNNFNSQLVDYFSSEGFDIQNLLPSVSEIQRMLPDVIKDISGGLSGTPTAFSQNILPPVPPPNIIPEPKRLDREECRQNLLDHIETLQKHVEDRLEVVEEQIENIENRRKSPPGVWSGMIISSKMQDVRSAKIVNNTLPDRL